MYKCPFSGQQIEGEHTEGLIQSTCEVQAGGDAQTGGKESVWRKERERSPH